MAMYFPAGQDAGEDRWQYRGPRAVNYIKVDFRSDHYAPHRQRYPLLRSAFDQLMVGTASEKRGTNFDSISGIEQQSFGVRLVSGRTCAKRWDTRARKLNDLVERLCVPPTAKSLKSQKWRSPPLGTMNLLFIFEKQSISIIAWRAVPYSVPHIGEQKSEIRGKLLLDGAGQIAILPAAPDTDWRGHVVAS
jgi:hypothetical protein